MQLNICIPSYLDDNLGSCEVVNCYLCFYFLSQGAHTHHKNKNNPLTIAIHYNNS